MKKGVLSIVVAIIGFYCIYRFNVQLYHENLTITQQGTNSEIISDLSVFKKTYKIIVFSLGLLSLYFAIISFLKKHKIGLIGIILALTLLLSCVFPFLEYAVEAYLSDINFQ
ncbi:hypothetical protein [Aquimarina sp. 2201CG14-23]|uniref:hypothetical protein n=1 Tax=Aquimarina mycalae TaxID=3040073 RepID=UPI00247823C7|nr:hypothetical protein [Aquimarina sp. 2201CG14-23]MDH7444092.1 hypothetical protein [Aquimarina sp. 2201CG14-23]